MLHSQLLLRRELELVHYWRRPLRFLLLIWQWSKANMVTSYRAGRCLNLNNTTEVLMLLRWLFLTTAEGFWRKLQYLKARGLCVFCFNLLTLSCAHTYGCLSQDNYSTPRVVSTARSGRFSLMTYPFSLLRSPQLDPDFAVALGSDHYGYSLVGFSTLDMTSASNILSNSSFVFWYKGNCTFLGPGA